ncbi:type IV pilus assembly PilZ [Olavius algarvensis associated proteobacterium Delta 3]|nr:type IV pilus assembly PilZ [Olavius algarvensis associated proteobacterium Delta 3]CAB5146508.1 type IV pilus assembly PilZ [Olavius algarvensis associated proteobacterium Delta 3]
MATVRKLSNLVSIGTPEQENPDERLVGQKHLVNKINYINFQDQTLKVNFRHKRYDRIFSLPVKPQPCLDENLECRWVETALPLKEIDTYEFQNIVIESYQRVIRFVPELLEITESGMLLRLPENGTELIAGKLSRRLCRGIQVQLIQTGAHFFGNLASYTELTFQVELQAVPPQSFKWINLERPISLIVSNADETLYAGECRIVEYQIDGQIGRFHLKPLREHLQRFGTKEFRSPRHRLVPSPYVNLRHPFTGVLIHRNVIDISGSGFSVEEDDPDAVFLPGMILPQVEVNFAGSFRFSCKVQVVYRRPLSSPDTGSRVKCGLALLDISAEDHNKLLALLHHAKNKHCYVCNRVDLDVLWDFFFETGFIYPQKYAFILSNKKQIKATYERLYNGDSTIARHFTYQNNEQILGHIAMLRFYDKAWLIHHHAGNTAASARAGLDVLNQIGRYILDSHRLHSIHMDYMLCYFRPQNKFPSRVFGRITRNINDPDGSSIDTFAYFHFQRNRATQPKLPGGWELGEIQADELRALKYFYEESSGGLMIEALNLEPDTKDMGALVGEYERLGLRRERHLFALKKNGRLTAVIIANISDVGLNLSDLTSSLSMIVLDPSNITRSVVEDALHLVSELYSQAEVPVMIFPAKCTEDLAISTEKLYNLWIMKTEYSDHYFRHLKRLLKFVGL